MSLFWIVVSWCLWLLFDARVAADPVEVARAVHMMPLRFDYEPHGAGGGVFVDVEERVTVELKGDSWSARRARRVIDLNSSLAGGRLAAVFLQDPWFATVYSDRAGRRRKGRLDGDWVSCGGMIRPEWVWDTDDVPSPQFIDGWSVASLGRCGTPVLSGCDDGEDVDPAAKNLFELTARHRILYTLASLTGSVFVPHSLRSAATPQHTRSMGVISGFGVTNCTLLLGAAREPLCYHHVQHAFAPECLNGLYAPYSDSDTSDDACWLDRIVPHPQSVGEAPFFFGLPWHALRVRIQAERHEKGTRLRITRRLAFVLFSPSDVHRWTEHYHNRTRHLGQRVRVTTLSRSVRSSSVASTRDAPSNAVAAQLRVVSRSGARTQLRGDVTATNPLDALLGSAPAANRLVVLLLIPSSVARPLFSEMVGTFSCDAATSGGEGGKGDPTSRTQQSSVRLVRIQHDPVTDTTIALVALEWPSEHDRYATSYDRCTWSFSLPLIASFQRLSERPPDAHRRYPLPQMVVGVPSSFGSPKDFGASSSALFPESLKRLLDTGMASDAGATVIVVSASGGSPSLDLATPDPAMIFNVLCVGLLPFAALVGSTLRRTGR